MPDTQKGPPRPARRTRARRPPGAAGRSLDRLLRYQSQLRALTSETALAEERERRRIATGLHDELGQLLALAKMKIGELRSDVSDPDMSPGLDELRALLDQALQATRSLIFELSNPVLEELGLDAALRSLGERLETRHGLRVRFDGADPSPHLDDESRLVLYRSVRELLFNVLKHARAAEAVVSLVREDGELRVTVRDDGSGFDPSSAGEAFTASGGFGLFSLRERIGHLGGHLEIRSAPGAGTRVAIHLPLRRPPRAASGGGDA